MNPRLEAEKATLIQRAEIERLSLAAAWIDARDAVMPPHFVDRKSRHNPWAARLLKVAIPVLGLTRVGRIVQMMSVGLTAYRIVRGLRY
ncbi:MAG TPA: hypothetical protein VIL19_10475 [Casimicrobiaceae bacterium]